VDYAVCEVHVPPSQREQLSLPQPGERRADKDGAEGRVARESHDRVHLLDAEDVELIAELDADLLRLLGGIGRDPALPLGATEDAAEQHEHLLRGLVRDRWRIGVALLPPGAGR
jgi:hypothetical protein